MLSHSHEACVCVCMCVCVYMHPVVGFCGMRWRVLDGVWQALGLNREGSNLKVSQLVVRILLKGIFGVVIVQIFAGSALRRRQTSCRCCSFAHCYSWGCPLTYCLISHSLHFKINSWKRVCAKAHEGPAHMFHGRPPCLGTAHKQQQRCYMMCCLPTRPHFVRSEPSVLKHWHSHEAYLWSPNHWLTSATASNCIPLAVQL